MSRHDRYGERLDVDEKGLSTEQALEDEHHCQDGWIDRDGDHPRPCLTCRPWLAPARRRPRLPNSARIRAGVQLCRDALQRESETP